MESPRFVILEHFYLGVHYDLMFEAGGVLKTWKLQQPPKPQLPQSAVLSFDHRLFYLDHEGPISGDRGHVVRWDQGVYQGEIQRDTDIGVFLSGKHLRGRLHLRRLDGENWELLFEGDTDAGRPL